MPPLPLVSVVIPCFNNASFLAEAIQSVLDQEVSVEILVVDDQSLDESVAIAEQFERTNINIRLIRRSKNGGPAAARNTGLRVATGTYICFLDADDMYVPGFFQLATKILNTDWSVAGLVVGVELIQCHRPVHPVQLAAVIRSLPANVILRRSAVDLLGGFPEDPAFRGPHAGEDLAFRDLLARTFQLAQVSQAFLRYRVRPGGHFDRFLDRSKVIDGQLQFVRLSPDEEAGRFATALSSYAGIVRERVAMLAALGPSDGLRTILPQVMLATQEYDRLCDSFNPIPGFLHPQEGFLLYRSSRDGFGQGFVVEIGCLFGRSTCWLAAGCRDAQRGRVIAVDHFRGSPEHQPGGSHPIPEFAKGESALEVFQANLTRVGLKDWVEARVGASLIACESWRGPIRLLFIDGDHSYDATRLDWQAWSRYVIPGGVVGFHDVGVWPGVTRFYDELLSSGLKLQEIARVRSLRLLQFP